MQKTEYAAWKIFKLTKKETKVLEQHKLLNRRFLFIY